MTDVWTLAALWLALALTATLFAIWLRVSTALTEIIVGTAAQFILGGLIGADVLNERALDKIPCRARRHHADVSRRRGA